MASKYRTYDQVEAAQEKAIRVAADVLEDDDLANDLESESVESYAERKGLIITNPQRRMPNVANGDMTKSDLQDCIDSATDILEEAYTPEASREDLAAAVGDALAALQVEDDDEEGDDTDSDDGGDADYAA